VFGFLRTVTDPAAVQTGCSIQITHEFELALKLGIHISSEYKNGGGTGWYAYALAGAYGLPGGAFLRFLLGGAAGVFLNRRIGN
jgi:hypothetical protein